MPLPNTSPAISPTPTTARGERVAEPKTVFDRDRVCGVGEGRGALVGRDDEVRVVFVMPHDRWRWHDMMGLGAVGDDVIGQIQQPVHQDLVALDPFCRECRPLDGRAFEDEPTL
jgi:hypothetical protein